MPPQQSSSDKNEQAQSLQIGTVSKDIKRKSFPDSWRVGFYAEEIHSKKWELNLAAGFWLSSCLCSHHCSLWTVTSFSTHTMTLLCGKHSGFAGLQILLPASHNTLLRELCLQRAVGSGPVFTHVGWAALWIFPGKTTFITSEKPQRGCTNTGTQLVLYSLS